VRAILGPDARPTIGFDRGGWSPKVFADLVAAGFDVLTYRKAPLRPEAKSRFGSYEVTDRWGHTCTYHLAERAVRLYYNNRRRYFSARHPTRRRRRRRARSRHHPLRIHRLDNPAHHLTTLTAPRPRPARQTLHRPSTP
jgi:hypothetical protein